MADKAKFTQEMQNYYDTLPAFIQESISQSSSSFNDLQSLRAFAEELKQKKAPFGTAFVRTCRFLKAKFPKCFAVILENRQVSCGFRLCL